MIPHTFGVQVGYRSYKDQRIRPRLPASPRLDVSVGAKRRHEVVHWLVDGEPWLSSLRVQIYANRRYLAKTKKHGS